jgi:hypothetical protein
LISEPELRISLGEKAFQSSRSFPSWPQCAKKFLKLIESHA